MIERHITFNVLPDKTSEFERFMTTEYTHAMAKSTGFIQMSLLREAEHPEHYQMVLRFTNAEAAAGWRNSQVHQALQPRLKSLHTGMDIIVYQVVA